MRAEGLQSEYLDPDDWDEEDYFAILDSVDPDNLSFDLDDYSTHLDKIDDGCYDGTRNKIN